MAIYVNEFLNTLVLMKSSYSSTALTLRSGKAVTCFILAHNHHSHAFRSKAWSKRLFALVVKYGAIDIVLKVIKRKYYLFIESNNNIGSLFSCSDQYKVFLLVYSFKDEKFQL